MKNVICQMKNLLLKNNIYCSNAWLSKTILCFVSAMLLFSLNSCEENISPKGPFTEKYILFCLLNTDTTFQTAYVSRSFDPGTNNPADYKTDPALEGAVIKLTVNNNEFYTFQEGISERTDTTLYKTPVKYYYLNNFKPKDGDKIEITATLQNGTILKSTATTPPYTLLYCGAFGTITYNPSVVGNLIMSWRFVGDYYVDNFFFTTRLNLVYSKADNPDKLIKYSVPIEYKQVDNLFVPYFIYIEPGGGRIFKREAVIRALALISQGDTEKQNYIIHEAEFNLQLVDDNLALYHLAEQTFLDEFTVRLDATDFTNIQNGFGVFGIYSTKQRKIRITRDYITSLGYKNDNY